MNRYTYRVVVTHYVDFTDEDLERSGYGPVAFAKVNWGDGSEFQTDSEVQSVEEES